MLKHTYMYIYITPYKLLYIVYVYITYVRVYIVYTGIMYGIILYMYTINVHTCGEALFCES